MTDKLKAAIIVILLVVAAAAATARPNPTLQLLRPQNYIGDSSFSTEGFNHNTEPYFYPDKGRKYKREIYAKQINQVQKRKRVAQEKKALDFQKRAKKYIARHKKREEFYDKKPTRTMKAPPINTVRSSVLPSVEARQPQVEDLTSKEEIYEEPALEYNAQDDETPLLYEEPGALVKPYEPTLWEKIKLWFSNKKFKRQDDFLVEPEKAHKISWPRLNLQKEKLDFLTPKQKGVSIVDTVKTWWARLREWLINLFPKKTEPPPPAVEQPTPKDTTEEIIEKKPDACAPFAWTVPNNIAGLGLRILNGDGTLSNQFNISSYLSIRPGQKFQLVPRCR